MGMFQSSFLRFHGCFHSLRFRQSTLHGLMTTHSGHCRRMAWVQRDGEFQCEGFGPNDQRMLFGNPGITGDGDQWGDRFSADFFLGATRHLRYS